MGHDATVVGWGYSRYKNGTTSFGDTGEYRVPTKIQQKLTVNYVFKSIVSDKMINAV